MRALPWQAARQPGNDLWQLVPISIGNNRSGKNNNDGNGTIGIGGRCSSKNNSERNYADNGMIGTDSSSKRNNDDNGTIGTHSSKPSNAGNGMAAADRAGDGAPCSANSKQPRAKLRRARPRPGGSCTRGAASSASRTRSVRSTANATSISTTP